MLVLPSSAERSVSFVEEQDCTDLFISVVVCIVNIEKKRGIIKRRDMVLQTNRNSFSHTDDPVRPSQRGRGGDGN